MVGMGGEAARHILTIPAAIYDAVMALSPDERRDRAKVNEAARQAEQSGER
jgi:hypothetical protein